MLHILAIYSFILIYTYLSYIYACYIYFTAISHDTNTNTKMQAVINLMVNYARFLTRAKGDFETAEKVYRKIAEVYITTIILLLRYFYIRIMYV